MISSTSFGWPEHLAHLPLQLDVELFGIVSPVSRIQLHLVTLSQVRSGCVRRRRRRGRARGLRRTTRHLDLGPVFNSLPLDVLFRSMDSSWRSAQRRRHEHWARCPLFSFIVVVDDVVVCGAPHHMGGPCKSTSKASLSLVQRNYAFVVPCYKSSPSLYSSSPSLCPRRFSGSPSSSSSSSSSHYLPWYRTIRSSYLKEIHDPQSRWMEVRAHASSSIIRFLKLLRATRTTTIISIRPKMAPDGKFRFATGCL